MTIQEWLTKNKDALSELGLVELPDIIFGHADALDGEAFTTTLPVEEGGRVLCGYGQHWAGLDVTFPRTPPPIKGEMLYELLQAVGYSFAVTWCSRRKGAALSGSVKLYIKDGEWVRDLFVEASTIHFEEVHRSEARPCMEGIRGSDLPWINAYLAEEAE
jgi:hypothetical protein